MHLIHSAEPKVREEPIDEYIARSTKDMAEKDAAGKPRLVGFKFLRLRDEPLKNLRKDRRPRRPARDAAVRRRSEVLDHSQLGAAREQGIYAFCTIVRKQS